MLQRGFSVTMVSYIKIVDEKSIEEVKDKSKNENIKKRKEYWRNVFKKGAKDTNCKFSRVQEQCSRPNTLSVEYLQK